jgi:hypothetical protein
MKRYQIMSLLEKFPSPGTKGTKLTKLTTGGSSSNSSNCIELALASKLQELRMCVCVLWIKFWGETTKKEPTSY